MAVPCSEPVTVPAGTRRADELAALVAADAWQRLSCADGSKGPRLYDWALIDAESPEHKLLVRRSLHPVRRASSSWRSSGATRRAARPLSSWSRSPGPGGQSRTAPPRRKNETGLDQYQVRKYRAWYRDITLAVLAHAFLAVTARATRLPGDGARAPTSTPRGSSAHPSWAA